MDPRIEAVRSDKIVGRGTCSVIDEAHTDDELLDLFAEEKANTPKQAVRAARRLHRLWQEQESDCGDW